MKEKAITAFIVIVIMGLIGIGTYNANTAQVVPTTSKSYSATNTFSWRTISGAATAVDLGTPICKHNQTQYITEGAWLTTSAAPGLQTMIQGSNDNTYWVDIATVWNTTSGTIGAQHVNACYRYVRGVWSSAAAAWNWTSTSTKFNISVTSGGQ